MSNNPYSVSSNIRDENPPEPDDNSSGDRVKVPAIFMMLGAVMNTMITCSVGFLYAYIFWYHNSVIIDEMNEEEIKTIEDAGMTMEAVFNVYGWLSLGFGIFSLLGGIFIVIAGIRMLQLKSWGLAMAGAILSLIPCFQLCFLIGIPVGIFALIVLSDSEVRKAFSKKGKTGT